MREPTDREVEAYAQEAEEGYDVPGDGSVAVPDRLLLAICDPGSFLRRQDYGEGRVESLPHWQARAVLAAGYRMTVLGEMAPMGEQ